MKRVIALAIAVSFTASVFGQGELIFGHRNSGSGQVLGLDGSPLVGATYSGQLYGGGTASALSPIVDVKGGGSAIFPFPAAAAPAALHGYVASQNSTVIVPGVAPGATAFIQLRVWNNQDGALTSWDSAVDVSEWGDSGVAVESSALGGPQPPLPDALAPNMPTLPGFQLTAIPEPTTWALLGIGALALCFRRRR
jgi:hypothetical protein